MDEDDWEPRPDPEFEIHLRYVRKVLWIGAGLVLFLVWLGAMFGWFS